MSGSGVKVYTDEDVDPDLAIQLSNRGYDVVSTHDAGRHNQGYSDESQLQFAIAEQRAILVFNVADFIERDADWRITGREHYGIIVALNTTPLSELIRRTQLHLDTVDREIQYNMVLWLPR